MSDDFTGQGFDVASPTAPRSEKGIAVVDRRVARALGFHVLAGIPVFLSLQALGLTTAFWVTWLPTGLIVLSRSGRGRRGWPWTLAWFLGWLVFAVVIFIALLSWDGPCPDCGTF